jgi:beta-N-acetylhexosaminidase
VSTAAIDAWPATRRAAQLVVLPSLDFNVTALAPSIRAGAGGVLFLGNSSTPPDLREQLADAVGSSDPESVPLVMADVEGGGVQRLKDAVGPFPWARDLAASTSVTEVEQLAEIVGNEMRGVGVDVDLAPVVDLDDGSGPNARDADGRRSYSLDASKTNAYAMAFARGLRAAGVLPVLKHFPGLGEATANTDNGPAATRPLSELRTAGLVPFVDGIAAGAPAIMVSNASVPGLTTTPASLSTAVIERLLRDQLGFSGLVMTDSLSAGAIAAAGYTVPRAAVAAIEAGADLVLFGSTLTPDDIAMLSPANVEASRRAIVDAIVDAFESGRLPAARLDSAVAHVLAAKGVPVCTA